MRSPTRQIDSFDKNCPSPTGNYSSFLSVFSLTFTIDCLSVYIDSHFSLLAGFQSIWCHIDMHRLHKSHSHANWLARAHITSLLNFRLHQLSPFISTGQVNLESCLWSTRIFRFLPLPFNFAVYLSKNNTNLCIGMCKQLILIIIILHSHCAPK